MIETLNNYFKRSDEIKGLDVGCGKGDVTIPLAFLGYKMVGVDISSENIDEAIKRLKVKKLLKNNPVFLLGDAENLPFKEGSFDFVICSEVLEHLKRPEKALKSIHEVLKPKGLLIVTVPNGYGPYCMIYDHFRNIISKILPIKPSDHIQFFTLSKIRNLIKKSGFDILSIRHSDFLSFLPLIVKSKKLSYYDCKLADKLPSFIVSGWYVLCRKDLHTSP
uniref:Class I SAM-dependent methyltransferase n=1 Tax=Fervidobacterium pennivorans TaxID=93466 RepID=A0A7V4KD94_FERPE